MPPEDITFQAFFVAKIKERGVSLKKLAEVTGIAPAHLESMVNGKMEDLPSSPYVHGYLVRLGKALDFDGDAWWEKIKKEGLVKNSGFMDDLPRNRFIKESPAKFIWGAVVAVIIIIYLAFQLPVIFGKPTLAITFPTQNPYSTVSSTLTIAGTVRGANSLSLNGAPITIAQDGSWQETVLLQGGLNTFQISAKKLLGAEIVVNEQVLYQAPEIPASASSTSATSSAE
jgi:Glucodextranase, domain B/Helix-turn-helix domain